MKKLSMLFALLGVVAFATGAAANVASTGVGVGIVFEGTDVNPCPGSVLWQNDDGSFENGYAWQYGGCVPPYYGAFAEGYDVNGNVCGIQAMLTALSGQYVGNLADWYVFASDGWMPGNVLSVTVGIAPGQMGIWPNITAHDIDVNDSGPANGFFVGYWGNWPGAYSGWFCAVDLDGFGGLPRTNIAPGIGYPTGWQDPSVVWGPTQAMGIRAYVGEGDPVPTQESTWGAIKNLYN